MEPMQEIALERKRQVEVEGWTAEHDDGHADGELLWAAKLYYLHAMHRELLAMRDDGAPVGWWWDAEYWKPKTPERDLVRAGALCLAERERLRRLGYGDVHVHVDRMLDLIIKALSHDRQR